MWGTEAADTGDLEEVYFKFIGRGEKRIHQRIWKRFTPSLLVGTEAAEAGDLEEVYSKFVSGGQKQP